MDYHIDEDLEQLFHSDLQNLMLEPGEASHDDVIGNHLPEWLIGVIVVIAMLIVAFFVMVITSLVKSRRKHRNATYTGTGSHTNCDDLESGKVGHGDDYGMKMTAFSSATAVLKETSTPPQSVVDVSDRDTLTSGAAGCVSSVQGCKNPLFVDDSDDNNSEGKEVTIISDETKVATKISPDSNNPSTSNGSDASVRSKGTSIKYKLSNSKKSMTSAKAEQNDGDKAPDSDSDTKKRIFASKAKVGSQTSSKRGRMNGSSVNGNISPRSEERRGSEEVEQVKAAGTSASSLTEIPSDLRLHDNEVSAGCEDSGIELSCQESQRKEEAGAGSESDDHASRATPPASRDMHKECNNGREPEVPVNNLGTSVLSKADDRDGIPPTTDIYQESHHRDVVCSQSTSVSCGTDTGVLAEHRDEEGGQDGDHSKENILFDHSHGSLNKAEELQLLGEAQFGAENTAATSEPRPNMRTENMVVGFHGEEEKTTSHEAGFSNLQRDDDVDQHNVLVDNTRQRKHSTGVVCRTSTAAGQITSTSTAERETISKSVEESVITQQLSNRENRQDGEASDRSSTNL